MSGVVYVHTTKRTLVPKFIYLSQNHRSLTPPHIGGGYKLRCAQYKYGYVERVEKESGNIKIDSLAYATHGHNRILL